MERGSGVERDRVGFLAVVPVFSFEGEGHFSVRRCMISPYYGILIVLGF